MASMGGLDCWAAAPASSSWVFADSGLPGVCTGDLVTVADKMHARDRVINWNSCRIRKALSGALRRQP